MFSVMCICQSVCLQEQGVVSVTITHDALDLTVQGPPPDMFKLVQPGPHCTGTQLRPWPPRVCSNLFIVKHVRLTSRQFASYWNAYCLVNFFPETV